MDDLRRRAVVMSARIRPDDPEGADLLIELVEAIGRSERKPFAFLQTAALYMDAMAPVVSRAGGRDIREVRKGFALALLDICRSLGVDPSEIKPLGNSA